MDRRGRTRSSEVEGRSTKYLGLLGVRCDEPVVRGMSSRERELRSFSSWLEANEVFLEGGELAHRMEPRARHGAVSSKPRSLRVRLGRKPKARHPKYYMKKRTFPRPAKARDVFFAEGNTRRISPSRPEQISVMESAKGLRDRYFYGI